MALDLARTALQIDAMAADMRDSRGDRRARVSAAIAAARSFDAAAYDAKRMLPGTALSWRLPDVPAAPDAGFAPPPLPDEYCVVGVDGSHIDVSRHLPARCFLINIGGIELRYGARHGARGFSEPRLYAGDDELVVRERMPPHREETISGALLDAKRAVEEVRGLADALRRTPADMPALGLLDGSLIMFGMHRHPDFVARELVEEGFAAALDDLRRMAAGRPLAVASYISLPRSAEFVNALRLGACPHAVASCDRLCGGIARGRRPCDDAVGGVADRDVFAEFLGVGERSAVFGSNADVVRDHYVGMGVRFFYLRTEEEIGRVELPDWVADDEALLGLTHALLAEQCRLGPGYPVALKEAHEEAVVSGGDRRRFGWLVEDALGDMDLPVYSSEKNLSKARRWL